MVIIAHGSGLVKSFVPNIFSARREKIHIFAILSSFFVGILWIESARATTAREQGATMKHVKSLVIIILTALLCSCGREAATVLEMARAAS